MFSLSLILNSTQVLETVINSTQEFCPTNKNTSAREVLTINTVSILTVHIYIDSYPLKSVTNEAMETY